LSCTLRPTSLSTIFIISLKQIFALHEVTQTTNRRLLQLPSTALLPSASLARLRIMDPSTPTEYTPDSAYSPHIVNEQDQSQEDITAVPNGHQPQPPAATATTPVENDSSQRYNSPSLYQQPNSRPGSGMGGHQQTQYQENRQPQPASKSSVVIKVGMVGDAQIGKTSLMVKYVEGSWDEDYIQTLGASCWGAISIL
jgi:hypothetical protein